MDTAASEQLRIGGEIERLINNFKKDSQTRKDLRYYESRRDRLDQLWTSFEEGDNQIRLQFPQELQHSYFANEYYSQIQSLYEMYHQTFSKAIDTFREGPVGISECAEPQVQTSATTLQPIPNIEIRHTADTIHREGPSKLLRRQNGVIEALRRILERIASASKPFSRAFCNIHMQSIQQYWTQVESIHQTLWELHDDPLQIGYNIETYYEMEQFVHSNLIRLTEAIDEPQNPPVSPATATTMKLPKVILPKFDGNYLQWRQFYDLFTQMVHNQSIGASQKMWYLKTNLSGEAERLIRHLPLSDENYTTAWEILVGRYNNTRLLITSLLNRLLGQVALSTESSAGLKSLHDVSQECLSGIRNLGVDTTNWGPIMVHILLKKLDKTTHGLYEQSLSQPRELQSLEGLLHFIEARFQALETLGSKGKATEDNKTHRQRHIHGRSQ